MEKIRHISTTIIIALGCGASILAGALLLMLPISWAKGVTTNWSDALFTATSATCVTGLVTVPTFSQWSFFGQLVVVLLIEVGGLGIISFTVFFWVALGRRIGLYDRMLIRDAYNLDSMRGMVNFVKKIFKGTGIVQLAGAVLCMPIFVRDFGLRGIWIAIFHSISAFCNAGMDIIGPDSLVQYAGDPLINLVTMCLIILGGLGFPVWWMCLDAMKERKASRQSWRHMIKHMPLHAVVVLKVSLALIFIGAAAVFLMEWKNPETMGNMDFPTSIQAAFFQSVTLRTAGFYTFSQAGLHRGTILICCLLMFIGGSPSGTAGGIKTTTLLIVLSSVISIIRERKETELFCRKINENHVKRAWAIFLVSLTVLMTSFLLVCIFQPGAMEDCLFEVVSAIGTVGLSRDLTGKLNLAGKVIIIGTMYLGRIGPISLAMFFNTRKFANVITYPEGKIGVG